jgi:hypothetical protein
MVGSVLCLAVVTLGIDAGWQPLPDGGLEYIIQLEPHTLERLKQGTELISDFTPDVEGVRSVRIRVGSDDLPRLALPKPAGNSRGFPEDPSVISQPRPTYDPFGMSNQQAGNSAAARSGQTSPSGPSFPAPPGASRVPNPLNPAPDTKPLPERPVTYVEDSQTSKAEASPSPTEPAVQEVPPLAWMITLGALAASVGGMLYLGWVAWDYRTRYRRLLDRLFEGDRQPWLSNGSHDVPLSS